MEAELKQQIRQQQALLHINRAVQEMTVSADLEQVARVCHEQLRKLELDFQGLAIHRLLDENLETIQRRRGCEIGNGGAQVHAGGSRLHQQHRIDRWLE